MKFRFLSIALLFLNLIPTGILEENAPNNTWMLEGNRILVEVQTNINRFYYQSDAIEGLSYETAETSFLPLYLNNLEVRVPVASLQSGNRKRDKDLMTMIQADVFPWIILSTSTIDFCSTSFSAEFDTYVQLAGKTNVTRVQSRLTSTPEGPYLQGELILDLRKYEVEPPKALGGLVRVAPEVQIAFRIKL